MTAHARTRSLVAVDTELEDFTERLFGHLPRADQRRWARVYLQGLLTTPGKKSVRRLAASVTDSPTASQSLQQFINSSPWDWDQARLELLRWAEERHTVRSWTITEAIFPKRGAHSVGVHRRFDPVVGRALNCQLGYGLFLSRDGLSVPVDWRLLLPDTWSVDPALRRRAGISPEAVLPTPESLVLALVEAIATRTGAAHAPVVADLSRLGDAAALVGALDRSGHDFLVSVPPSLSVAAAGLTLGTTVDRSEPSGSRRDRSAAGDFARMGNISHPYAAPLTGSHGGSQRLRIQSGLVRLPDAEPGRRPGIRRPYRLFADRRPTPGSRTGQIWLTNMTEHRMDDLLRLIRQSAGSTRTLGTLADDFGLLDFEGRSFRGWHHHMTLMSAAYAYRTLQARDRAQDRQPLDGSRTALDHGRRSA